MMKNRLTLGVSIMIVLVPVAIWMQIKARESGKKDFEKFNAAEIHAQVESVKIAYKGTGLKLSDGREFVFYPITNDVLNDGRRFNDTAEKGDTIIKKAYADTLYLIKDGKRLAYTFAKAE